VGRLDELFSGATARLAERLKLGRLGKIQGTRALIPHESYRLVYEIIRGNGVAFGFGSHSAPAALCKGSAMRTINSAETPAGIKPTTKIVAEVKAS
jgi:hypothetical protein